MVAKFPEGPGSAALRIGRCSLAGQAYLITFTTHDRRALFGAFERTAAAARALHESAPEAGFRWIAWVLMPDHVHLLLELGDAHPLARCVGRAKAAMTRALHEIEPDLGEIWARGFHDHALRADEDVRAAAYYVICNPVRAGLVQRAIQWPFWNAYWL